MPSVPPAPPCLLAIFGAGGDLTKRLLLPSIYNLASQKTLPDTFRLLGIDKQNWDDGKFRDTISIEINASFGQDADAKVVEWITSRAFFQSGDFTDPHSFECVKSALDRIAKTGNRLFYLAVGPNLIAPIASQLSRLGLLKEENCWSRLIVEKPFGHDLPSGITLNRDLRSLMADEQIYRIDHFAGKDAVQDLAVLRFSNSFLEPLWNRSNIENVQITAAETVGLENRAGYYEKSGALRDMVPNHLAEMLSFVAMEAPVSFTSRHMRDKQVELLASVRGIAAEDVPRLAVRGQYAGYREEKGADHKSNTETYAALQLEIDNWRWAGVPFYLRTGKRLAKALTEVVVTFRQPPARLFPPSVSMDQAPNQLIINLKPDEKIQWLFNAKLPGLHAEIHQDLMEFQFPKGPFGKHAQGYEGLLYHAMTGEQILFQRGDFVEEGWRIVQPVIESWSRIPADNFPNYAVSSTGPEAADKLLAANGHAWHSLEKI